jgi:hypothetical protein
MGNTVVSLKDPYTNMRMATAARFVDTAGAAPSAFDLEPFLDMAQRTRKWMDPHSSKPSSVQSLQVCHCGWVSCGLYIITAKQLQQRIVVCASSLSCLVPACSWLQRAGHVSCATCMCLMSCERQCTVYLLLLLVAASCVTNFACICFCFCCFCCCFACCCCCCCCCCCASAG